jgi:hypothetical protein
MSPSKSTVQQCLICQAFQPLEANRCTNCGAALNGVLVTGVTLERGKPRRVTGKPTLEGPSGGAWDDGEADLHEGLLPAMPLRSLTFGVAVVMLIGVIGFFVAVQTGVINFEPTPTLAPTSTSTDVPVVSAGNVSPPPPTNTKPPTAPAAIPTLPLATVTPAPATATITPTQGPCEQRAGKGDTVYGMAARCGHKHLSIVEVIIHDNAMKDANSLQEGQLLIIPWPTPEGGGEDGLGPEPGSAAAAGDAPAGESTLPAGVGWYTVKLGDTAVAIAYNYRTTMKTLRDLNPEIQFLQCDFGMPSGGPSCNLRPLLAEGQRLRVPAPTPTPSLSPTYTGSETATPTGTATFNAPFSQSPDDNMLYESSELPALRWVASGQLSSSQVYLVTVVNLTINQTYTATTHDLSFQLPGDWQPNDGRPHKFQWSVAVASLNDQSTPIPSALTTETRTFTWHSR